MTFIFLSFFLDVHKDHDDASENKTKQNKIKQNKAKQNVSYICDIHHVDFAIVFHVHSLSRVCIGSFL